MKSHYTYVIHNNQDGRYYIGARSCEGSPDADAAYLGSSKTWTPVFKANPDVWEKYVIQTYPTREAADADERKLLSSGHFGQEWCLNGNIGGTAFFRNQEDASATQKEIANRPDVKARKQKALRKTLARPEVKAAISAIQKETWTRPEVRAKRSAAIREALNRPETRAKMVEIRKKSNSRPEVKAANAAAQKVAQNKPEVKAKRSAAQRAAFAKPEVKARLVAAQKAAWVKRRASVARPEPSSELCSTDESL